MIWIESELRFAGSLLREHYSYCQTFLKGIEAALAKEFGIVDNISNSVENVSLESEFCYDSSEDAVMDYSLDEDQVMGNQASDSGQLDSVSTVMASWCHPSAIDQQLKAQARLNPRVVFGQVVPPRDSVLFERTHAHWQESLDPNTSEVQAFELAMGYDL